MVNKHKSVPSKHRLHAWKFNNGVKPIYELQPKPKIDDSRVVFSPDGKYFADSGSYLDKVSTTCGSGWVNL